MKINKNDSPSAIIERIREGDATAFRLLVEAYKDVSFSLACSILRNDQDAEDALQEAFIKVYRNIHQFRKDSTFSTWFYKIVVNTCWTHLKKQQKRWNMTIVDKYPEFETVSDSGYEKMIARERTEIITRLLESLKPDEGLLLRLYYLAELNIAEIKKVTGFKESKIKVTLFRARKSLQKKAEKIFGNEFTLKS